MVAFSKPRRVVCHIVRVAQAPQLAESCNDDFAFDSAARQRPSRRLPWSDPQIASLVTKLQHEVRQGRGPSGQAVPRPAEAWGRSGSALSADLEPPCPWLEDWGADEHDLPPFDVQP